MRAYFGFAVAAAVLAIGAPRAALAGAHATANVVTIVPTTTLTAETSNNTSASSSFTTKTDGDIAPGNVSKVAIKTLLYPGFNSPVYVHFQAWFGGTNHMNVGYTSDDATQVHAQISDMLSRGLAGMVIDWYGPTHTAENNTTILVMQDAQTRGGQFAFAVALDGGALKSCAATAGCSVTQTTINLLNYAYTTFEQSSSYMKIGGRPVVPTFGTEFYNIDWATVVASVSGAPLIVFRNSGGFSAPDTSGGYSWVAPTTTDPTNMELGYLDNFYKTSLGFPAEITFGSGYKGFNDTLASWGTGRIIDQFCGQTWLDSLAEIGKYYNSSSTKQPNAMQMVTWNDYEEGTEIETGIDNCVSISASMSEPFLNWSITGQENTIDHYTVFVSLDGQNLMPLTDVPAGTHTLNLGNFSFAAGTYIFYIKAVGRPSLLNHMSNSVAFIVSASGGPANTSTTLTATPEIFFRQNASFAVQVTATSGTPTGSVALLMDGNTWWNMLPLDSNGKASGYFPLLRIGTHHVSAMYLGNSSFNGSTSASETVQSSPRPNPH